MEIFNMEQGSPEWFEGKLGKPSSSNFGKILTPTGKPSTQAKKYLFKLAMERLSGTRDESYTSFAMQRGVEMEEEARDYYSFVKGVDVEQIGFALSDGCISSTDGLVGDNGLIEIKCVLGATMVEYKLDNKLPTEYIPQVQGELMVLGREWCDFVAYYPNVDPFIIRIERDPTYISKLRDALEDFNVDLDNVEQKLRSK